MTDCSAPLCWLLGFLPLFFHLAHSSLAEPLGCIQLSLQYQPTVCLATHYYALILLLGFLPWSCDSFLTFTDSNITPLPFFPSPQPAPSTFNFQKSVAGKAWCPHVPGKRPYLQLQVDSLVFSLRAISLTKSRAVLKVFKSLWTRSGETNGNQERKGDKLVPWAGIGLETKDIPFSNLTLPDCVTRRLHKRRSRVTIPMIHAWRFWVFLESYGTI